MINELNPGYLKLKLSVEEAISNFNNWLKRSNIPCNPGNYKEFKGIFLNYLKARLFNNDSYTSIRRLLSIRHFEMDWDIDGLTKLVFQESCGIYQGGRETRSFLGCVNIVMEHIDLIKKEIQISSNLDDFKRELRQPMHKIDLFNFKTI